MKPEIIVLCGIPCSGKSTWRNTFVADNPQYVVISSDEIIQRIAVRVGIDYNEAWQRYANMAGMQMMRAASNAFQFRHNIIWDQTNLTIKKRATITNMATAEYRRVACYFEVPTDVALARNAVRASQCIPEHVIVAMAQQYCRPTTMAEDFNIVIAGAKEHAHI